MQTKLFKTLLLGGVLLLPIVLFGQGERQLTAGRQQAGTVAPGQEHSYTIRAEAGQFLLVKITDAADDLSVDLTGPDGSPATLLWVAGNGAQWLSAMPAVSGAYRLSLQLPEGSSSPADYQLRLQRQEPLADTPQGRIDQLMAVYDHRDTPGLAVAVLDHGQTAHARGYGMANLENGIGFSPETVSDIGSVAKQLTDMAIVLLAQKGKLSLDDDIRRYLPDLPDFGTPIRIRHLVHHTSGLREIYDALTIAGLRPGDGIRQEDGQRLVQQLRELNFPPGSRHLYCNTGYMLLADIVAKVSGQPFESWMREHIFLPLGMTQTFIMDQVGEIFPRCADSYQPDDRGGFVKIFDNSSIEGAGGVYTTLNDLARWLDNYRTHQLGGPAAFAQQLERGVLTTGDTLDYAFGLVRDTFQGEARISHTGSSAGYRSLLAYVPGRELGVLIKTNRSDVNTQRLGDLMLTLWQGLPVEPRPASPTSAKTETPAPPELGQYAGTYFCPELETTYQFSVKDGQLTGRHARMGDFSLTYTGTDTFEGGWWFDTIHFERDATGRISGLRMSSGRVLNLYMEKVGK